MPRFTVRKLLYFKRLGKSHLHRKSDYRAPGPQRIPTAHFSRSLSAAKKRAESATSSNINCMARKTERFPLIFLSNVIVGKCYLCRLAALETRVNYSNEMRSDARTKSVCAYLRKKAAGKHWEERERECL